MVSEPSIYSLSMPPAMKDLISEMTVLCERSGKSARGFYDREGEGKGLIHLLDDNDVQRGDWIMAGDTRLYVREAYRDLRNDLSRPGHEVVRRLDIRGIKEEDFRKWASDLEDISVPVELEDMRAVARMFSGGDAATAKAIVEALERIGSQENPLERDTLSRYKGFYEQHRDFLVMTAKYFISKAGII